MSNPPIKSASREFTKDPFYLVQANGTDKRYVVSLGDKVRIRTLLAGFINRAELEVQVKIRSFDNEEEFVDYSGLVTKTELHRLMTKHEDALFHHGFHDFMVRLPETDEYVVFDEHGLIFLYTNSDYTGTLTSLGAAFRPNEQLIYEVSHWHYCLPDGKEKLVELIEALGLEEE